LAQNFALTYAPVVSCSEIRVFAHICRIGLVLCESIVRIAIEPAFTWFCRRNDRVATRLCMPGCMPVGRGIATQGYGAGLTSSQMDPI
jgi:hypothetical protein